MRLRDAAVGDVLERTDGYGELQIVRVTAHSAGGGETWYLPCGHGPIAGCSGYIDVERHADWTPTPTSGAEA